MSGKTGAHVDSGERGGVVPGPLFTWVDVDERLAQLAAAGQWPEWLLEADAWWDQLVLAVSPGTTEESVSRWLDRAFGLGSITSSTEQLVLGLDRPRGFGAEGIPVVLEETDDLSTGRRVPRLAERRTTVELARTLPRPQSDRLAGDVQIIAFHSFKGGVGRTVHAVALADDLARSGHRVLLIDADLEAPGITWMHQAQGGTSDISYEDVLALLHGTSDGDTASVAEIVRGSLVGQFVVGTGPGRLAILPATRRSRLGPPRIEPVDLLTHDRSRYFLTESLAELASAAGLDTVIIDLRAGASELSAPVLLDPRVQRVFVTTLSSQSLDGTVRMIRQLGAKAPALLGQDPAPTAVVTQYRLDVHDAESEAARRALSKALDGALSVREGEEGERDVVVDTQAMTATLVSPFRDELLALPGSWDDVVDVVRRCGLGERVAELARQLSPGDFIDAVGANGPAGVEERRAALWERAAALVFAERTGLDGALGFLSTEPLRRLIGDHRGSLPVTVVVGAKGAGKTFTYARMCAAGSWPAFAAKAGMEVLADALVVPVLDPANLDQSPAAEGGTGPQDLRDRAAGGRGATRAEILRLLNESLRSRENSTDPEFWSYIWLRCMAIAGGSEVARNDDCDAESELLALGRRKRLLFVFDGLEDFLQELDGEAKRVALRALLVDVPEWLRSVRGRPLGLVVFVRRDLAAWAIRQNLGQFLDRYEPYALRWDAQEALRLALWVAVTAGVVPEPERDLTELPYDEIAHALHPVWGAKLGSDSSREAWSDRWVPAALADFNDQVQARDVVRFLRQASELSEGDERTDRLLVPSAMRNALARCSAEKVKEISQENRQLGDLLNDLGRYAHDVLMPFEAEDVGLDANGITVLQEAGALAKDADGRYRLPEIYRHALRFRTQGRARVVRR
ncbi:KGGVGR-motif variant AAA ATPase [Streptomyces adelaidensis]|uniref:KGGVGR-motif variant AAA ATPase n=1 Tax=Streptomyces adelaidensis TaxID=2796465 RepID=UPI00190891CF|nr:AAA family ATPase [Streptomyces adelaidensis]